LTRILIRATNWVGDAVMSLPAIRAIRARFPDAHIAILARPWVFDLYAREGVANDVIPYTAAPGRKDLKSKWALARRLSKERFDTAILFQNAFEAALIAKLAGIPRIIGYKRDGRGFLLSQSIPVPAPGEIPRHERFYYLELLRRAGIIEKLPGVEPGVQPGAEPGVQPEAEPIHLTRDTQSGAALFAARNLALPVIGVSPGAAYGNAKRWLPERFAESAAEIADFLDSRVALFGSESERELCESVARLIGPRAINLAGRTTLREFIDMAAACRLFLTNDSGAMHIASALGVPSVTVFGATDDTTTGPTGPLARILREPVECSPCLLRECPIDHRCMTRVPVSRVTAAAFELCSIGE
jgi:heptosyltransferase II